MIPSTTSPFSEATHHFSSHLASFGAGDRDLHAPAVKDGWWMREEDRERVLYNIPC
jgi:hypothetical protein